LFNRLFTQWRLFARQSLGREIASPPNPVAYLRHVGGLGRADDDEWDDRRPTIEFRLLAGCHINIIISRSIQRPDRLFGWALTSYELKSPATTINDCRPCTTTVYLLRKYNNNNIIVCSWTRTIGIKRRTENSRGEQTRYHTTSKNNYWNVNNSSTSTTVSRKQTGDTVSVHRRVAVGRGNFSAQWGQHDGNITARALHLLLFAKDKSREYSRL